jgi:hypothetical protein
VRDVENRALQDALRPYAAQLQKIAIYVLHPEESQRLASWAVGRFDVDQKSAYTFFHDFLGAPNGMLMLNLMQTDIIISVVPMLVEPQRLSFAVSDYDFGLRGRIG